MLALVLAAALVPAADHHTHLLSPTAAATISEAPLPTVVVPDAIATLLRERTARWNDAKALAEVYTDDAIVLDPDDPGWIRGSAAAARYLSTRFSKPYEITPVAFSADRVVGYYTRAGKYLGHVLLSLSNGKIAAEMLTLSGPYSRDPVAAEQLIAQLDDAGIQRAAVLSVAYWYRDDYAKVKGENDWVAQQVAKYPQRLIGFCGVHPLKEYAVAEVERCATLPQMRGIKMQLGNSRVDYRNEEHMRQLARVFEAANRTKLAIVVHLWNGPAFGRADAEIFLDRVLPAAPNVPVQIAHFAGGGPGYTDDALAVFAEAIRKNDPRTKNLYFDVATVAAEQPREVLQKFAGRIRQVGLSRVLYGTDSSPPNPPARVSWGMFRAMVPLTDEEMKTIAGNVAPYLRKP